MPDTIDDIFDAKPSPSHSASPREDVDTVFDEPHIKTLAPVRKASAMEILDEIWGEAKSSSFGPFEALATVPANLFDRAGGPQLIHRMKGKAVNAISPTPGEIEAEAGKTGKVPYGKIAGRTAAETAASLIPESGLEIESTLAAPQMVGALSEAFPVLGESVSNVFKRLGYDTFDVPSPPAKDVIPFERLNQIKGGAPMTEAETNVMQGKPLAKVSLKKPWLQAIRPDPEVAEKGLTPYSIYKEGELESLVQQHAAYSEIGSEAKSSPLTSVVDDIFGGKTPQTPRTPPEKPDNVGLIHDHEPVKSIIEPTPDLKPIAVTETTLPGSTQAVSLDPKNHEDAKQIFRNIVEQHVGRIASDTYDSTKFVKETFLDKLKPEELDATTFLLEKGATPSHEVLAKYYGDPKKAQAVLALVQKPTPQMLEAAKEFRIHDDMNHKVAKGLDDDMNYVKDHVMHLWDLNKFMNTVRPSSISTYNPATNQRTLRDYATGMNKGFVPKTLSIAEITSVGDNYTIRMKRVSEMVNTMKTAYESNGVPLAMPDKEAFPAFQKINHPLFRGLKFHPDVAQSMNNLISKPLDGKWINAYEVANALDKQMKLSLGFFHHATLTQMAAGLGSFDNPEKAFNFFKRLVEGVNAGGAIWREDPEMVRDALSHNLMLGDIADFQVTRVQKMLGNLEQNISQKVGSTFALPFKALDLFQKGWNKQLWANLNNTVMLDAYQRMVADTIPRFPNMTPGAVKSQVADFINHATGHEVWEKMMMAPVVRQGLQALFLAPEFNIALIKSFFDVFSGGLKFDWSQFNPKETTLFSETPKGYNARLSWARAAMWYFLAGNAINYTRTKAVAGKGKWLWENEEDHKLTPFVYKDLDGRNAYINLGKPYLEVFRWLQDPVNMLKFKLGAIPRAASNQMFPDKFHAEQFEKEEFPVSRLKTLATDLFEPFILSKSQVAKAKTPGQAGGEMAKNLIPFSVSKGMTPHKLEVEIYRALKSNDRARLAKLQAQAQDNNLDFSKYMTFARRGLSAEKKRETKTGFTLDQMIPQETMEKMKAMVR